jgi:hypothetical protein
MFRATYDEFEKKNFVIQFRATNDDFGGRCCMKTYNIF